MSSNTLHGSSHSLKKNNKVTDVNLTNKHVDVENKEHKKESLVITFEDLAVQVRGLGHETLHKLKSPFNNFLRDGLHMSINSKHAFSVFSNVSGSIKTKEMVLVLGTPGSGKSTLLRALSGRLNVEDKSQGKISINGEEVIEKARHLRRISTFVSDRDTDHAAELTVRETLTFAANCSLNLDARQTKERVNEIMEILGLAGAADTVVGDEQLRGISGGQKRRVTLGEMIFKASSRFLFLDNITNGLDATTSVSIIEYIRKLCNEMDYGAMVTLLQPSAEIIKHFDKILVLAPDMAENDTDYEEKKNRAVYYGPPDTNIIVSHFCPIGAQIPSDTKHVNAIDYILNNCTHVSEDNIKKQNINQIDLDHTNNKLETESALYGSLLERNKYETTYLLQFWFILKRQAILTIRNKMTYARVFLAVFFGVVCGSLFSTQATNLMGTFSIQGYLFITIFLALTLSTAVTLPNSYRQRPTFLKHVRADFYSVLPYYIANILVNVPSCLLEATILACCSLWIDLPGFWYFLFSLFALELVGQAWARILSYILRTEVSANMINTFTLFILGSLSGYMPTYTTIGWWFRWMSWICPTSYAYEGTVLNAIYDRSIYVISIPTATGSTTVDIPGSLWLSLMNIPRISWGSISSIKALDLGILFVFALVLDCFGLYCAHKNPSWYADKTRLPRKTCKSRLSSENMDSNNTNVQEKKESLGIESGHDSKEVLENETAADATVLEENVRATELSTDTTTPGSSGSNSKEGSEEFVEASLGLMDIKESHDSIKHYQNNDRLLNTLLVNNLQYSVPDDKDNIVLHFIKKQFLRVTEISTGVSKYEPESIEKRHYNLKLLTGVSMVFHSSRLCALMGESGAGKTTLLDVIAGYKTAGYTSGDIVVGNYSKKKLNNMWHKISGYAEQNDILNSYLSVHETLLFAARCLLPQDANCESRVKEIIEVMDLTHYANMAVGREKFEEGIPKHVRRRLTIGLELIFRPKILFLDEPTTGLDNISSSMVMAAVKRSALKYNLIVVATIHQPKREIFEMFDDLLLLAKGGKVAYAGPVGESSSAVVNHFEGIEPKLKLQPGENSADYILNATELVGGQNAHDLYLKSESGKTMDTKVSQYLEKQKASQTEGQKEMPSFPNTKSVFAKTYYLFRRQLIVQWRNREYSHFRIYLNIAVALFLGILLYQKGMQKDNIMFSVVEIASLFYAVFALITTMQASVVPVMEDRSVLYRETNSGYYNLFTYGIAQLLADIPFHFINTVLFFVIFYFFIGLRSGAEYASYFLLMYFMGTWLVPSIGQLFAYISPNTETANGGAGISILLSVILMGFLITINTMPESWKWANWSNVFRYMMQGFCVNEVGDRTYYLYVPAINTSAIFAELLSNLPTLGSLQNFALLFPRNVALSNSVIDSTANQSVAALTVFEDALSPNSLATSANTMYQLGSLAAGSAVGGIFSGNFSNFPTIQLVKCLIENKCFHKILGLIKCAIKNCQDLILPVVGRVIELLPCINEFINSTSIVDKKEKRKEQMAALLCFMRVLLPENWKNAIKKIFGELYNFTMVVVDIIQELNNGTLRIPIPGNIILWYFGWADLHFSLSDILGTTITANTKWWYCIFAIGMFLLGLEVLKLFSVSTITWIKR